MKILFIYPKFIKYLEQYASTLGHFLGDRPRDTANIGKFNAPPALAIPYLTAVTPKQHTWEFVNDNIETLNYETDADVIAISFFTPQATRAYAICQEFKKRNKLVVVGGMHPSICPQEAMEYANIVCAGEGELCWPEILSDIATKSYKKLYIARQAVDLETLPLPNRFIYYRSRDLYNWKADIVQVARGCSMLCQQCIIPCVFGKEVRFQAIERVLQDIRALEFETFYLADDQIFDPNPTAEEYAFRLFHSFKEAKINKQIFVNTAPSLNHNPKLLKLMGEAGVNTFYSTIGFDPISQNALLKGRKNLKAKIIDEVKNVQDAGMLFFASFPIGLDEHTSDIKHILLDFCLEAKIALAEFFLVTPLPGTQMWKRLEKENRILHKCWEKYNGAEVTFLPRHMTAEALMSIYIELWQEFPKVSCLVSSQR